MSTRSERREVAARLREAAVDDGHVGMPYGKQGFQVTLRRIIGTSNPARPTLYARLADLIDPDDGVIRCRDCAYFGESDDMAFSPWCWRDPDPTCHDTLPDSWGPFECSECGAQFSVCPVYIGPDGTSEHDEVKPSFCPRCGARVVEGGAR